MPADPAAAVILAAGAGRRLGGRPKVLQEVGGRPLIEWALERLAAAGVSRTLVVTGAHADDVDRQLDGRARSVHNPLSQEYENFVSLAVGLQAAPPGRVLVLNGDVIVADGVLQAVLAETAALALGVCFGETDDEALRVEIREGRVVRLGKGSIRSPAPASSSVSRCCRRLSVPATSSRSTVSEPPAVATSTTRTSTAPSATWNR